MERLPRASRAGTQSIPVRGMRSASENNANEDRLNPSCLYMKQFIGGKTVGCGFSCRFSPVMFLFASS